MVPSPGKGTPPPLAAHTWLQPRGSLGQLPTQHRQNLSEGLLVPTSEGLAGLGKLPAS